MATRRKSREERKAAGWLEVMCLVPPALAKMMEALRGDVPRSQWLIRQALGLLPEEERDVPLVRRTGRPRTRPLPALPIPLEDFTYRPIRLYDLLKNEVSRRPVITLMSLYDGRVGIHFTRGTRFGGVEVYSKCWDLGGRWNGTCMVMPGHSAAEKILEWVRNHDGLIRAASDSKAVPAGTLRARPLIRRLGDDAQAWSMEIDYSAARKDEVDPGPYNDLLNAVWNWSPVRTLGWFSVDQVPDLVVSSGMTAEVLRLFRSRLASVREIDILDGEPYGISGDVVEARADDDLGLYYGITADRRDRRALVLPERCLISQWVGWRDVLDDLGVEYREVAPEPPVLPDIDWDTLPGWNQPAHDGGMLYRWQREGVEFAVRHNFRCLIGDEMRVGKTAQAVTALKIKGCRKILVLVPRTAMMGWRDQILRWRHKGDLEPIIIEIASSTSIPALPEPTDRPVWVLTTVEGITPTTVSTVLAEYDADQRTVLKEAFEAAGAEEALRINDSGALRVILDPNDLATVQAVENVAWPDWAASERERLSLALIRVRGPVLTALTEWDPDGITVDEAHKIKNPQSNRTKTLRALLQDPRRAGLLLSGSPVPNTYRAGTKGGTYRDGIELIRAVVPVDKHITQARKAGLGEDAISLLLLEKYMIRRLLSEVQPDLPKKIRETIEVPLDPAGSQYLDEYLDALSMADELVYRRVRDGDQFNDVHQDKAILGQWEKARRLLGQAKVAGGYTRDVIVDAVEQTGSCVVFVSHHEVGDMLEKQLTLAGMAVVRNDSRLSTVKRRAAIESFQAGIPDVYLGGLGVAEGFSLNRASVCVHVQLDYTPDKMAQAEARAQGVGQNAPNGYLVRTCIAAFEGLPTHDNMDVIITAILDRKVDALKLLPGGRESLSSDKVVKAGAGFSAVMVARSWQRAQERLTREGITPPVREPKAKPAKPSKKKSKKKGE
ncbi:hypothetical protein GGE65_007738 [Skermanella aerolata]|uniref:SNF2-related protein n=1 Tax=Skermanella aerolata TaxID=393310 RepID=UPI003D19B522